MTTYAQPEDLPPLELVKLRELDVIEPEREGRARHIAEASGIAKRGDWVYVVGDENLCMGVFRLSREERGEMRQVLPGELSLDAHKRKGEKPDLETIATLPPFEGHEYGLMLGMGSGSGGEERERAFAWSFAPDGSLSGEPTEVDLGPAYELLRSELGEINIEGAAVIGDRLRLLNRGNKGGANAVCDLSLEQVERSLHSDLEIDPHEVLDVQPYELGELNGVPIYFSDGAPMPDGRVVFTASAERDDPTEGEDEIEGSVVGVLETDGSVRRLRTIDRRWKVEGVHATIDTGVVDMLFCCDQDDPDHGSPLLLATMPLDTGE